MDTKERDKLQEARNNAAIGTDLIEAPRVRSSELESPLNHYIVKIEVVIGRWQKKVVITHDTTRPETLYYRSQRPCRAPQRKFL